jgi:murein L,D-transpeptidase YcbB/YkuD
LEPGEILAAVGALATALGGLIGSSVRGHIDKRKAGAEAKQIERSSEDAHWQALIASYKTALESRDLEISALRERLVRLEVIQSEWPRIDAQRELQIAALKGQVTELAARLSEARGQRRPSDSPTGDLSGPVRAPERKPK